MANEENLIPCKKGHTNNPNGRPKGTKNMSTVLRDILKSEIEFDDPLLKKRVKNPVQYAILLKLTQKALNGDMKAINSILDRSDGRPTQVIQQTNFNMDITDEEEAILKQDAIDKGMEWLDYCKSEGLVLTDSE